VKSTMVALWGAVALVLAGCSTLPKVTDISGVDVSVTGLTDQQVMIHYGQGGPFEPDPYIHGNQILSGDNRAYVIVRIELPSIRRAFVTLDGVQAVDSNGTVVASLYSKREFLDLLRTQGTDEQLLTQLHIKIERTYFPDGGAQIDPGSRSYAVVLVGKAPLPVPLTVSARISVDGGTPRAFNFQWSS
jgi:hypothetical protein